MEAIMTVYLVYQHNDLYDASENVFVFSTKAKALQSLRSLARKAEENGMLDESHVENNLAYVTVTDTDNMQYTYSLDLVPKKVY